MKYVLLIMGNIDGPTCGEDELPGVEDFLAFDAELEKAGVLVPGGFALEGPELGTSVSKSGRDAEPVITAGPYAESREFVGGSWILDVPTIDEAIRWAGRSPGAIGGRVEVRPLFDI